MIIDKPFRIEILGFGNFPSMIIDIECLNVSITKKSATYQYKVSQWPQNDKNMKRTISGISCDKGTFPIIQKVLEDIETDPIFCFTVPIKVGENLMLLSDFVEECENKRFINLDGYGEYATREQKAEGHKIYPSDIENEKIDNRWTHVVWYNQ